MLNFKKFLFGVLFFILPFTVYSDDSNNPHLISEEQRSETALIIAQILESYHYTQPKINNELSSRAFDKFFQSLDPNRMFFNRSDIIAFELFRNRFDDYLREGNLQVPYVIFDRYKKRVKNRISYAIFLLNDFNFNFEKNENYTFDRKESSWPLDEKESNDLWRKRVKNDILSGRLSENNFSKETLRKRYSGILKRIEQMNDNDIFQTFVNSLTLSIEPHTSYMSPRRSEDFDIGMRLSLQGIGAILRNKNEFTEIVRTVVGGPAAKSGKINNGDRIIAVGQGDAGPLKDVTGWRLQDVVELIRGPKGSVVRLKIMARNQGNYGRVQEVTLTRDKINLEDKAAKSTILKPLGKKNIKIGVIDIPTFYRDFRAQASGEENFRSTTRDVKNLLIELQKDNIDGIIIDLRQNGGGSLTEATELTGLFIKSGPVVQVLDTTGQIQIEEDIDPSHIYKGPLAVLVDRDSASASEIFAGAIQDYGRGLIIGESTFGKGTVQTLIDLKRHLRSAKDIGRLRLTMAQFFRVQGSSTQHKGVIPDVLFPTNKNKTKYGESSLDNAIPWASIKSANFSKASLNLVSEVKERNIARISKDPGFRYLIERENELVLANEKKDISLQESVRKKNQKKEEDRQLESRNRYRVYRGLSPLESFQDEEDSEYSNDTDLEKVDQIMLDESARVLTDYIRLTTPLTANINNP
tara:strand:- start:1700 stop:3781 length:2082 start_codon:yes stop_codon:yes gene_type:complete